jgi:sulfatase maturation enzyme AslB (radical SAM superfamily)
MKLDQIGFYTLNDERAKNISTTSPLWRACILVTSRCNFSCKYCNGLSCDKDYDFDTYKPLLADMCLNHGLKNIRFSGGEPTLHPRLLDFIKEARSYKCIEKIAVSTNGSADLDYYKQIIAAGVNDFSISCDTCDSVIANDLAGRSDNVFDKVISNIREMSKLTYVILGITISESNSHNIKQILEFADSLGVADMKLSTSTHWNQPIPNLETIPEWILNKHPILKYRVSHFKKGRNVRGLRECDCHKCMLVQDDMIIVGSQHYACIVQAREKASSIGTVKSVAQMRLERREWAILKDTHADPVCKPFCMDIFADCNNRIHELAERK